MPKLVNKRKKGRKPLPKETLDKMKKLLKEGNGYAIVAQNVGVGVSTVFRYNQKWGL
jgi:hypothetical protein